MENPSSGAYFLLSSSIKYVCIYVYIHCDSLILCVDPQNRQSTAAFSLTKISRLAAFQSYTVISVSSVGYAVLVMLSDRPWSNHKVQILVRLCNMQVMAIKSTEVNLRQKSWQILVLNIFVVNYLICITV